MAYMECLPESMRDAADWALNCEDGELLPCHSLFLASTCRIFTNFAGLGESVTAKKNNKNEIPLEETVNIAEAFLDWMYSHKITTEAPMLYRLAALAHRLNAPGGALLLYPCHNQIRQLNCLDLTWLLCSLTLCYHE